MGSVLGVEFPNCVARPHSLTVEHKNTEVQEFRSSECQRSVVSS
jgi:hypothetical protein